MNDFIDKIENETLRRNLKNLHSTLQERVKVMPASVKYHQNWTGGYRDHVRQVIQKAMELYRLLYIDGLTKVKPLVGFTMDDVILVAYIHDMDKLFRYQKVNQPRDGREWEYAEVPAYDDSAKITQLCAQHGIILGDNHLEALAMHHGGWSANNKRDMSPLAVIIHSADLISTYITNHKGD